MWRNKKLIVGVTLAAVMLFGGLGAVAFAADSGNDSQSASNVTLLDRVCEIYQEKTGITIDQEALKDSFAQAQRERREAALEKHLAEMVDKGVITEEESSQIQEWWKSRPDVLIDFGPLKQGNFRGMGQPPAPLE